MILGEFVEDGAERILKKFDVEMKKFCGVSSVSLKHLKKGNEIVASYLLVYVGAEANVRMINLAGNKGRIIESDYLLMHKDFEGSVNLGEIDSEIN